MDSQAKPTAAEFISKPASVIYEEFNQELIALVNNTGLPKFCLIPVVADVLQQLREAASIEYERDFSEWQKNLSGKEKEEVKDEA